MEIEFQSDSEKCLGTLYLPVCGGRVPCVVMANGFSGTRDWILPDFAKRFRDSGLAVLTFDYRHLGTSEGQPRQIVSVRKQIKDLESAVAFARKHAAIDDRRIALWGTSLGGAYVSQYAARDSEIAAVVLNMPALDAVRGANVAAKAKQAKVGPIGIVASTVSLVAHAVVDATRGFLGMSPHYIPIYGKPGHAFFTDLAISERFAFVERESPSWKNQVAPRFLFEAPRYQEGTMERIRAPILLCLAKDDVELDNTFVRNKVGRAPDARILEYSTNHFGMYHEHVFEKVSADQTAFLREKLT